ncbi:mitochondrial 54S ribosomal protein uL3m [Phyllosticta citribraziliensis]|uniref:Large ribosomal subunit protein uL3m n=1 Tax=Phyllosticta citribraziliensis TaxID=989973 RepID=A0ABR1M643_9PEZI
MPPRLSLRWAQSPIGSIARQASRTAAVVPQCAPSNAFAMTSRGMKSVTKHPHPTNRFNHGPHLPVLGASSTAALERKAFTTPLRSGAIAIKRGMTAMVDPATGLRVPCTVLQIDRCQVVSHKRRNIHGYWAVAVGSGYRHPSNITRPMLGHYAVCEVSPKEHIKEFRVKDEQGLLAVGQVIGADWFLEGQFVDARANTKGKGFAGGMKKHGWGGQPASHGQSLMHRGMGSSGGGQGSGSRVLPGRPMAGRMGNERHTVQNLKVLQVDKEMGIVVVNGAVPGPKGCLVMVQDAIKKAWPDVPAVPVAVAKHVKA